MGELYTKLGFINGVDNVISIDHRAGIPKADVLSVNKNENRAHSVEGNNCLDSSD